MTADRSTDHIAPPVNRQLIQDELGAIQPVRHTRKLNNAVYVVHYHNCPHVMREIGRLREWAFTLAGGGTGKEVDIDERDTAAHDYYRQLIIYDPKESEITGGYRFLDCASVSHPSALSTSHYFHFSEQFTRDYLPHAIELGRSWINPQYQFTANPRKGLFALDNLWDGLGAVLQLHPRTRYFFGKVTTYKNYDQQAKQAVLGFMKLYFPDREKLVWPKSSLYAHVEQHEIVDMVKGVDFQEGLKVLQRYCKERGETVPPLINHYMQLSSTMKSFGTAQNPDFGDVEETGIVVTIDDIHPHKKERHL